MTPADLKAQRYCRQLELRIARAERDEGNEDGMREAIELAKFHHSQVMCSLILAQARAKREAAAEG